jgi:hypothetical protein
MVIRGSRDNSDRLTLRARSVKRGSGFYADSPAEETVRRACFLA